VTESEPRLGVKAPYRWNPSINIVAFWVVARLLWEGFEVTEATDDDAPQASYTGSGGTAENRTDHA
jgi:hypothetical protein